MSTSDPRNSNHWTFNARAFAGTLALFFSAGILFLALIDRRSQLTFMPESWFVHRSFWYLFGMLGFLGGCLLLRDSHPETAEELKETRKMTRLKSLVLYTRAHCPLCDDAKQLLESYRNLLPACEEVDIDESSELVEKFGTCVPVVEIDGKVRFRGRVSEILLRRLIEAHSVTETEGESLEPLTNGC
ncbi:MAG: hypothetical protein Tsb009_26770 [Planctomycetaceae bacterium]